MILRVWRAKISPERVAAYRRFNSEQCLPMLRKQPGFLIEGGELRPEALLEPLARTKGAPSSRP